MCEQQNESVHRRLLVIDDNERIHEDFRKILCAAPLDEGLSACEAVLFGSAAEMSAGIPAYEVDCAAQGQEGVTMVSRARDERRPYAVAFVDARMPRGWDGIETIVRLWEEDADVLIVLCSAALDYTWSEIRRRLSRPEQLVILKKPFDGIEILQLAGSLTEQWRLARAQRRRERTRKLEQMISGRSE